METILERIKNGHFWRTAGGIHLPARKTQSTDKPIASMPVSKHYYVPLKQHIGEAGSLLVKPGDKVLAGQPLTEPGSPMSLPVHAPTSGTVREVCEHISAHPSQLSTPTLVIDSDGEDRWQYLPELGDWQQLDNADILNRIAEAGISGLGGAGFPSHIKVNVRKPVEFLVINAAECEPYISADDLLMQEKAEYILEGIDILCQLLNPSHVLIGIEDDKPIAISTMKAISAHRNNYHVCELPCLYPSGGEKQLIEILTGQQVPHRGLPIDIGVVVQNVGTTFAIQQAVCENKPLIERVLTVTGDTVAKPQNVWARIGTPVADVLAFADFDMQPQQRLIMGGPMMGFALSSTEVPVVKTTNCILAPSDEEMPPAKPEMPCIRCGACADGCPASLLPQQLVWYAKAKDNEKLAEYNLFDCIECGVCAAVCPSDIPLVEYYRIAKADIRESEQEKIKAEQAKVRFEARQERLEREKQARLEKHKRAAEAREKALSDREKGNSKDAVAAALARAKAKKQSADSVTTQTGVTGEPDNSEVIAARAARKEQARQAKQHKADSSGNDNAATDNKKAAVAAAIARAKAKKAAQASASQDQGQGEQINLDIDAPAADATSSSQATDASDSGAAVTDPKKAAVAAAIARAKAKKAAKLASENPESGQPTVSEPEFETESKPQQTDTDAPEADAKKAAVAAAIARAKAKKAAKEAQSSNQAEQEPDGKTESSDADDKKARVASAVAKAKAKKVAEQTASPPEENEKQARVAAAVAKAKKQQKATKKDNNDNSKAKVANAVAKAKSKKQAEATAEPTSSDDDKKARVAAAVAKAKAKRAEKAIKSED